MGEGGESARPSFRPASWVPLPPGGWLGALQLQALPPPLYEGSDAQALGEPTPSF